MDTNHVHYYTIVFLQTNFCRIAQRQWKAQITQKVIWTSDNLFYPFQSLWQFFWHCLFLLKLREGPVSFIHSCFLFISVYLAFTTSVVFAVSVDRQKQDQWWFSAFITTSGTSFLSQETWSISSRSKKNWKGAFFYNRDYFFQEK